MTTATHIEIVTQAIHRERDRAVEICELCEVAGQMSLARRFIAASTQVGEVKRKLAQLHAPAERQPTAGPQSLSGRSFDPAALDGVWAERMKQMQAGAANQADKPGFDFAAAARAAEKRPAQ